MAHDRAFCIAGKTLYGVSESSTTRSRSCVSSLRRRWSRPAEGSRRECSSASVSDRWGIGDIVGSPGGFELGWIAASITYLLCTPLSLVFIRVNSHR